MSIPSRPSPSHASVAQMPDFRNLGVWLRLLLAANGLMLAAVLAANRSPAQLPTEIAEMAALVEPALLLTLALLYLFSASLQRLPARLALLVVVGLAIAMFAGVDAAMAVVLGSQHGWRAPLGAGLGAAVLLYWLALRTRAYLPAVAEARLAALNARIRPHFFFNSLNAVLGVMREDPRRAEAALEELAELFRALMRDNRNLTPLSEEIALARKYLDIERLRLGERLQVRWDVDDCPPELLAPPLLLQPLLENAVYHGIELSAEPAEIRVHIAATRDGVGIEIENPCAGEGPQRQGNRMALENLRERLMLFYDLEARLEVAQADGRYRVRVDLPRRTSP